MKIDGYNYFGMKVGDKVFYPVPWERIVVPCIVVEVEDCFSSPSVNGTIWRHTYLAQDGTVSVHITVPTKETDERGWPKWRDGTPEDLADAKQCSQFLGIDEPVGHSLLLGDTVFLSLAEARSVIAPSNKKRLKLRLKRERNSVQKFIASTWERNGIKHPGWEKLPLKRVYVRSY